VGVPQINRPLVSAQSQRPPSTAASSPGGRNFMQENKLGAGAPVRQAKPVSKVGLPRA